MSGGSRHAFQLWPALEHKGKQSVISAIAVDDTAQHIYLGTSDGQLEEHRIHSSHQNVRVSLGARKHIGKKVKDPVDRLPVKSSTRGPPQYAQVQAVFMEAEHLHFPCSL